LKIKFLGAAETVTGSKYLLESNSGQKIMIDCGLFQGTKNNREKNWAPLKVNPAELTDILLTHAHIDHSGYLPKLPLMALEDSFTPLTQQKHWRIFY